MKGRCHTQWGDNRFKIGSTYEILSKQKKKVTVVINALYPELRKETIEVKEFVLVVAPDGEKVEVPADYFGKVEENTTQVKLDI